MPVTVVVGGQYGSEGKGKVSHFLAKQMGVSVAIRVGGPNSGHTVIDPTGSARIFRHLPTAAILPDVICVLPAGSYIDPDILQTEIRQAGLSRDRLVIDPNAIVISTGNRESEAKQCLRERIGSTGTGVGAAVISRIERRSDTVFAKDHPALTPYVTDGLPMLRASLCRKERVLLEGTQGYGLSLLHSREYPYVTSRDTTASGFISEAGLSPLDVEHVVLVLRAYPIRVSGQSGPLLNEISWDTVTQESGSTAPLLEYTSVTKSVRRVAHFSPDIVRRAIAANRPTKVVLNHIDYVDAKNIGDSSLSDRTVEFLNAVEASIGTPIDYIGLSPSEIVPRMTAKNREVVT